VTVAFCLVAMAGAFALIWRGHDVRVVLFALAMLIAFVAGEPEVVFRKTFEALADARYLLPICTAMGFAYVVRDAGCVEALVRLLVRPIQRVPMLVVPGSAAIALVVNSDVGAGGGRVVAPRADGSARYVGATRRCRIDLRCVDRGGDRKSGRRRGHCGVDIHRCRARGDRGVLRAGGGDRIRRRDRGAAADATGRRPAR
jgi:hypothetical protein